MSEAQIDDGLTDEERAALEAEEGADTEAAGTDDTKTDDEEKAAESAAAKDADDANTAAEAAAAEANAAEVVEAPAQQSAPILIAHASEDFSAKLTEIEGKKDTLLAQFDDGDITAKEYQKQLDALAKEERTIERQQFEVEIAQKMEQQRLQNDWSATCNRFVDDNPVYKDNPRLYKMLDAEVRELASKTETAQWSGQKFLDEAHKALKSAFNLPDVKSSKQAPPPPRDRNLPPSIAKVPSAEVEDTNGGRFAVLDRLANNDPMAYEETLAKMSETERTAYLNA